MKPKPTPAQAQALLAGAELLLPAAAVRAALARMAAAITEKLQDRNPLVLAVMSGAVVLAGQLLPMLSFPLDFDYVDATRYGDATHGGALRWRVDVPSTVRDRIVLVIDDILDEGHTLAAISERLREESAREILTAVFADKVIHRNKPIAADFIGVEIPDRYVFGFGMDVYGLWRNLPALYALRPDEPAR